MLIDTAVFNQQHHFKSSAGLCAYKALENVLHSGIIDEHVLSPYKELCIGDLQLQMSIFLRKRPVKTVDEAASIIREWSLKLEENFLR